MTTRENQNMRKRVDALESRLMAAERAQRAESTRAVGWNWPRDTWLGRTTSVSLSSYPTSGDTFQVELLTGYFTAAEGTRAVTESLRGTKVYARTWPAAYLPYGTEVVTCRMRGTGPSGSGEWWIPLSPTQPAARKCAFFEGYSYNKNRSTSVTDPETYVGPLNSNDLLLAPQVTATDSTSTSFFTQAAPTSFNSPWVILTEDGVYRVHWQLRVRWPQLTGSFPYGTRPTLTSGGQVVDVWDGTLFFSTCSLRMNYQGPSSGLGSADDIGSASTLWAKWQADSESPGLDVTGLWQRYCVAGTRLRPMAYIPSSTLGGPYRVTRSVATLEQLSTSHA